MSRKIKIFDTTLRDGEQSPGFSMNLKEKLILAKQLERLGVDVIEAGFAAASPEDFKAVKQIATLCSNTEVCGLARCHEGDIQKTIEALEGSAKPRIHVFIATSDIHLEHKLKISRKEAIKKAIKGVKMAKSFTDRVDFSPEDATRSDREFLVEILDEVIKAGVDTINIPDTVGYSTPEEFGNLMRFLIENVKGASSVIWATHCHNDLGLAAANSLAGVLNGAGQIECTMNGIGERAGNAALEEIVMAIKTRPDIYQAKTNIDASHLYSTSKLLSQITGQKVQINKAIVGKNSFSHEAGIHQHGILANPLTYEIMTPESVGREKDKLVLGKHSGRNALDDRLQSLGIDVDKDRMKVIFEKFKVLADKKKNIYDEDIIQIAMDYDFKNKFELKEAEISSKKDEEAEASAIVKIDDKENKVSAKGDGPISALYSCIIKASDLRGKLTNFVVNSMTPEREAIGMVNIVWTDDNGQEWSGHGADTDTTIAAGKALIDVLNRMEIRKVHEKIKLN